MANYFISGKRIAKNTFLLYVRMIIVTLINIYTVRVVLDVLGIEDYGIYNVVAGVVSSLSFLSVVMSASTQRYYSFSIGESNHDRLKSIFTVSLLCYLIFAAIVVVFAETIGLWIVKTQLTIPKERFDAAIYVYQFSILSFIFTALQVPFSSLTIAKEDMSIWSIISIADTMLKLVSALCIPYIKFDRLIVYGASLSILWLLILVSYIVICRIKYPESCVFKLNLYNHTLFKDMMAFSGWTMYGSLAGVGLNQGISIIINVFFGPVANAARSVGLQIYSAVYQFCCSVATAVKPPIVKSYATHDMTGMLRLFYISNKVLYYSAIIVCIPLFFEMDYILSIWLKQVSDYMVNFSKYSLVFAVLLSLHNPITIMVEATGKIRNYRVLVESITLLAMPLTWIAYKLGANAEFTYIIILIVFFIAHLIRVSILSHLIKEISIKNYFIQFLIPAVLVTALTCAVITVLINFIPSGFVRFVIVLLTSFSLTAILAFAVALSKEEKQTIKNILKSKF